MQLNNRTLLLWIPHHVIRLIPWHVQAVHNMFLYIHNVKRPITGMDYNAIPKQSWITSYQDYIIKSITELLGAS